MNQNMTVFLKIVTVMAVVILAVLGVTDVLEIYTSEEFRVIAVKTIKILGIFVLMSLTTLVISKN